MRLRFGPCVAATALLSLITITGCDSGSDETDAAATDGTSPTDVSPPPEVGQCRNTKLANLGENDWVDETPPVECSQPHTLETVDVIEIEGELTKAVARESADARASATGAYVGPTHPGAYRAVYPIIYWPSAEQRAAGQAWVRCDMGIPAETHCCLPLEPQTETLRDVATEAPERLQLCIEQLPEPSRSQPLTPCDEPHRAELMTTRLTLQGYEYPADAVLLREGRDGCQRLISYSGSRYDGLSEDDLEVTPFWQTEQDWSPGELIGGCWVHLTVGRLPPI